MTDRAPPRRRVDLIGLALFLAASFLVAALGGSATATSVDSWYPTLAKPPWTPPSWLFPPVWTVLFAVMAVAAWLVWRRGGLRLPANRLPLAAYALQLVLNGAWSWLFFALQRPDWALVDVALLWLAIGVTTALFYRRVRAAGWLLVPYLAWVTYAAALNLAIVRLN